MEGYFLQCHDCEKRAFVIFSTSWSKELHNDNRNQSIFYSPNCTQFFSVAFGSFHNLLNHFMSSGTKYNQYGNT